MFHIFHFLQSDMVFGIALWKASAISSEKSCLNSMPLVLTYIDVRTRPDSKVIPACWILFGQFKFPAHQPYARWFTACVFDIWHRCFSQLTPVKTRYPLTSITWPDRELRFIDNKLQGWYYLKDVLRHQGWQEPIKLDRNRGQLFRPCWDSSALCSDHM